MSESDKRQLEQQLWNIANTLRGKMDADEFRDYILGFIFFKYPIQKEIVLDSLATAKGAFFSEEEDLTYDNIHYNKLFN